MLCQLNKLAVYYEVIGEGRPLVMLHGRPLDHRHMVSVMEPLFESRPGWKRIYLDLPGMGQTPGPDWIVSQDQVLDIVMNFIDTVIPGERFSVAGLSYGGYLTRGLVYCRAAQLDGVLLIVPSVIRDRSRLVLPEHTVLVKDEALMAELDPDERQSMESMIVVQCRDVIDQWRAVIGPAVKAADQAYIERTNENFDFSYEADLGQVQCAAPTLILTGRQDDACGYQQAGELLDQFPRATFAVLDSAGHNLPMEQQRLFRALSGEWLDRVARRTAR